MALRPLAPEASASANSATSAGGDEISRAETSNCTMQERRSLTGPGQPARGAAAVSEAGRGLSRAPSSPCAAGRARSTGDLPRSRRSGSCSAAACAGFITQGCRSTGSSTVACHRSVLPSRRIRSVTFMSIEWNQPGQPSHVSSLKSTVSIDELVAFPPPARHAIPQADPFGDGRQRTAVDRNDARHAQPVQEDHLLRRLHDLVGRPHARHALGQTS